MFQFMHCCVCAPGLLGRPPRGPSTPALNPKPRGQRHIPPEQVTHLFLVWAMMSLTSS